MYKHSWLSMITSINSVIIALLFAGRSDSSNDFQRTSNKRVRYVSPPVHAVIGLVAESLTVTSSAEISKLIGCAVQYHVNRPSCPRAEEGHHTRYH